MEIPKIKMLGVHKVFSWGEAFSDKNGKTSMTSIAGAYITAIGGIVFLIASIGSLFDIHHALDILNQSVIVIGFGGGLLGVNKVVAGKTVVEATSDNDKQENAEEAGH